MRREQRSFTVKTVEVPVSVIAASDLAEAYLPSLELIADSELKQMGVVGKAELGRRKKQRAAHVMAGRVYYVRRCEGFLIISSDPKVDRLPNGHLNGNSAGTPSEAIWTAERLLERKDQGGVIYVDKIWGEKARVIDVRPNACEALAKTGEHDWRYDFMGGDICGSCGLAI